MDGAPVWWCFDPVLDEADPSERFILHGGELLEHVDVLTPIFLVYLQDIHFALQIFNNPLEIF